MLAEQLLTQAWLPAEATRGAAEGQQMLPRIWTEQVALQVYALELNHCLYGQLAASLTVSQTVIEVELTVVELIRPHVVTQLELLRWMMEGVQAMHL